MNRLLLLPRPFIVPALLLSAMSSSSNGQSWKPAPAPLMTRWAGKVSPRDVLPEYPRPQMVRQDWQNLNGLWYSTVTDLTAGPPTAYDSRILVPFVYESALSGIGKKSIPNQRLWYRRTFSIPRKWKDQHVMLNFGAINYEASVFVNGAKVGEHRGGYDGFAFDITDQLRSGKNELVVSAWNPVRADVEDAQVLGKQRLHPGGIFYTAATGIWQPVWLEPVPAAHITGLRMEPDIDAGVLRLNISAIGADGLTVLVEARDGRKLIASVVGSIAAPIILPIPQPRLWSPDDPHLYDLRVTLQRAGKNADAVTSYFAMRKVSLGKDPQGRTRIFLNNRFLLEIGALDQGYWPDGIYTAPTDKALSYDIEVARQLGLNLLRKHAKVEPARWYYHCDRLGMLVWQDMPQMFGRGRNNLLSDDAKQEFEDEWRRIIAEFYNSPCIIVWTTFNEGWGQHDTESVVALTKQLDPTRLVNDASGWTDKGVGDLHDTHAYPGPGSTLPEENRAAVNGEFGGVTMAVPGHRWTQDVMGYGAVLKNDWLVTRNIQNLMKAARKMADERGTSAFVYTQITDVEQEINGLMTYDRAIIKPDAIIIRAANQGRFLPLPPEPPAAMSHDLVPTSEDTPQNWAYTTQQPGERWMQSNFDDRAWKNGPAPFGQGYGVVNTPWTDTPGDIWLRRTVTLPGKIPAKLDLLALHDEDVEVYINGVLAASATGYVDHYVSLPMSPAAQSTLMPGPNVIAVHCRQTVGGQVIDVGIVGAQ